ncbi:DUF1465 family protein, partial [Sandarakinorhabdus sp.]|uniref:DUF1465 family protein n=1 Tax=Sandarakinorhabdus sp. TaxID=1916663 RepID=UPI003342C0DC
MTNFSSSKFAVVPAQFGAGGAGVPAGPAGNANLGSLRPLSSGAGSLQAQLEALFRDTHSCGRAAREWFDGPGAAWRAAQPPEAQALCAMESLAVTGRLLAVMNWLLDPANSGAPARLTALRHDDRLQLPDDHPLAATPGGAIARTSRQ